MATFDLQGATVGARLLRAIQRTVDEKRDLVLNCANATFVDGFELRGAFLSKADFSGAVFQKPVRLTGVKCGSGIGFDDATASHLHLNNCRFEGLSAFRGVKASSLRVKSVEFDDYASFDEMKVNHAAFRDVTFGAEARFRKFQCEDSITFRSVDFAGTASFQEAGAHSLSFPNCHFDGPLQTDGLVVSDSLKVIGARLAENSELELVAGRRVELRDCTFLQSLTLIAASPHLNATGTCFERGADILLQGGGSANFSRASFLGPTLISTQDDSPGSPARLDSLDRARIDRLTLQGLDLSACRFARLHQMEGVLIAGRGQLALAPPVVDGSYGREVIADEVLRRSTRPSRMLMWAPVQWVAPIPLGDMPVSDALAIADIYRAMRKAREDANDYPGAADFYYGEMEMRRDGADHWLERSVLTLYWLISGYGLRAARSLIALALVLALLCVGFQTIGFENPHAAGRTIAWTATTSISFLHPIGQTDLTSAGMYLSVAARVLVPALLALSVLALRSRVKR